MKNAAKRDIIAKLKAQYPVGMLCEALDFKRGSMGYKAVPKQDDSAFRKVVIQTFRDNHCAYGLDKMCIALRKKGISIGRPRLFRIMKEENLVSKYVLRRQKATAVNHDEISDKLNRSFSNKKPLEVVASDLTYVDVNHKWNYICLLIELSHREIIGYAAGPNKDANLVKSAWMTVKKDIRDICIFHTDRGSEFKNEEIDKILEIGNIERSLSRPGTPIDNAVFESMYDIVKTEFIFGEKFKNTAALRSKLGAWVWWYNNERIHSSLSYKTPVESRESCEIGVTDESLANQKYKKFWKTVTLHSQKVELDNCRN